MVTLDWTITDQSDEEGLASLPILLQAFTKTGHQENKY